MTPRRFGLARVRRGLLIASPFLLIALGGWSVLRSPWPAILRATLHGEHIYLVRPTWTTVGSPLAALACWIGAIVLSLRIKPRGD